jgi:hypothetical protein
MGATVGVTLVAASVGLLAAFASQREAPASLTPEPAPTAASERWVCRWDPTINQNWHDDYLCTKGDQSDRPHLIPGDGFVGRDEIDQAAAKYEAQLNS